MTGRGEGSGPRVGHRGSADSPEDATASMLARWYRRNHRSLPWRETRDPYRIWLSEIMLQQTRVTTVLPYYERFVADYPSISDLAEADEDTLLKSWEGLGYYARCRNLHRAAKTVVDRHGGRFPTTRDAVEALPGIGRSTAGAILCFSDGQRHAVVDGNVVRVLTRLYDIDGDVTRAATKRTLWTVAEALLARADDPAIHNQAMMELGATVCARRVPDCGACPVADTCQARATGTQAERPVKRRRGPTPHFDMGAAVTRWDGRILIRRRPSEGLLGGLWEFPALRTKAGEAPRGAAARACRELAGVAVETGAEVARVDHAFSHFKITLHAFEAAPTVPPEPSDEGDLRWVRSEELRDFAFPRAADRVRARILGDEP